MKKKASGGNRRLLQLRNLTTNARQQMDAVEMLSRIGNSVAKLFVFDPQYRTGLDHLKFGNEGSRQKSRYKLPQMKDDEITFVVEEAQRILQPSAHCLLWIDKFALGSGQHLRYLKRARSLRIVDVITWNKMNIGMGRRARCVTEFLIVCQKEPVKAKGFWTDHGIPDCWSEAKNGDSHTHAKPHVLMERLIRAVTKRGDIVVDPCAGGYGVLTACRASGREFVGCDLIGGSDAT
jgi:site-specific DNA-methyltransferase (adenine-specific)